MSDNAKNMVSMSQQLLSALPAALRRRFASLDKYTKEVTVRQLGDRNFNEEEKRIFLRSHLSGIQGVVLAIVVCDYLGDGIEAAHAAIRISKSLEVDGFVVGSTEFSEDSPHIWHWQVAHRELMLALKDLKIDRFAAGRKPWDYVGNILEELLDGKLD